MESQSSWTERFPVLAVLAGDPVVGPALTSRDPERIYVALSKWLRANPTSPDHPEVQRLVADRRHFLFGQGKAPSMFAINGVGTRLYGESERDPADGTYVATLFATFVFIPVFPLRQYLVRPAGGRTYSFFGKVPFSSAMRLWRQAVGALAALAVIGGAGAMFLGMQHADVTVLNGLSVPVTVQAGEVKVTVAPGSSVSSTWKSGDVPVTVTTADGRVIERVTCQYAGMSSRLQAFNVLGAAPVVLESVHYSEKGGDEKDQPEDWQPLAGPSCLVRDGVDFAFVEPPQTIEMGEGESVATRWHAVLAPGGYHTTLFDLVMKKKTADLQSLGRKLVDAFPDDGELVEAVVASVAEDEDENAAPKFLDELVKAHPRSLPVQRAYEDRLEADGEHELALTTFRTAYEATPKDPVAGLLYARLLGPEEAKKIYAEVFAAHPEDQAIRQAYGALLVHRREFAAAEPMLRSLWKDAPALRPELLRPLATSLVAAGKADEAGKLVAELPAHAIDGGDPIIAAAALGGLTAVPRLADWRTFVRETLTEAPDAGAAEEFQLLAGKAASTEPPGADDGIKARLHLLETAQRDPDAALDLWAGLKDDDDKPAIGIAALLLAGEALREGREELADDILAAEPSLQPYASDLESAWQGGDRPDGFDGWPLEVQAADAFIRARRSGGSAAAALLKEAKAADVLQGFVTTAMAKWPAPKAARAAIP